ncbi:hypothetical protein PTSG_06444 [Salpingoeca rosetta]|uniref:Uncharacterized protein n=1 Tax=Salpingoeca rosetta (strain ATCC 50818 / BSB-021) TaxID=946362 RepID=F2UFT9_SALR5|nr:uncharacterized protein PTSG_06444 [Salpingoeca rosetta]EGD75367.1 hypothetical protein PTSG_06444 [Salpingoeca rosetta]|eukprot:XP_004991824.1 hypothetical protein PTSG_06444 [Salpingoeca rosetta]
MDYIAPVPKMEEFVPGINRTMRLLLQHAVGRQLPSRVQHAAFVTALSHVTPSLPLMVTFTIGESDHHRHQQQQQQQQQQHHQSASRLSRALSRHGDEEEADAVSTHTRLSAALRVDSEPTELYRMSGVLDPNALLPLGAKEGGKQLGTAQIGGGAGGPIQVQEYDLDTSSGGESSSEEESGADQAVFVDMSEI